MHHLANLPDVLLFRELATGLELVQESAVELVEHSRILAEAQGQRGAWILDVLGTEEAAKFLILLDAVRCPRKDPAMLSKHLEKFYGHLAKLIYARACARRVNSFGELRKYIEEASASHYLDGPSGTDWIYRNQLIDEREGSIYVDYVEVDSEYKWCPPVSYTDPADFFFQPTWGAVQLITDLYRLGATSTSGLEAIARRWHPVRISDDLGVGALRQLNWDTARELASWQAPTEDIELACRNVAEHWPFPMYGIKMNEIDVDLNDLEGQRFRGTYWE